MINVTLKQRTLLVKNNTISKLNSLYMVFATYIQGGPIKTEQHIAHNMWMQQLVSVDEVSSPENNKITNFGSVVSDVGHILLDNIEVQNFPFSAKTRLE